MNTQPKTELANTRTEEDVWAALDEVFMAWAGHRGSRRGLTYRDQMVARGFAAWSWDMTDETIASLTYDPSELTYDVIYAAKADGTDIRGCEEAVVSWLEEHRERLLDALAEKQELIAE